MAEFMKHQIDVVHERTADHFPIDAVENEIQRPDGEQKCTNSARPERHGIDTFRRFGKPLQKRLPDFGFDDDVIAGIVESCQPFAVNDATGRTNIGMQLAVDGGSPVLAFWAGGGHGSIIMAWPN